ncbi:hypothetical protein RclHR1_02290021 [Rhizophagus clarus]|uniref:Uncharacterized protein n=1 Tax=Rhizophagus clarus TaxID=94130 RepID=A0A2Z6QX15_9GLOM|nr:hypothetical protein RclHR1_02290021 [Rhizophagus clarus]GES83046.1 hypothetical protein RCL_jg19971.t2 [Rhizophagus clarus]
MIRYKGFKVALLLCTKTSEFRVRVKIVGAEDTDPVTLNYQFNGIETKNKTVPDTRVYTWESLDGQKYVYYIWI